MHPGPASDGPLAARDLRSRQIAISVIFLSNGTAIGVWAAHIPLLRDAHQLSEQRLGLVLLGFAIGAITTMILTGALTTRFDSGRVTIVSGLAFCGALGLPAFAATTGLLFMATLLLGACNGAMDVSMNTDATRAERLRGAPMMSRFHAFFSLGGLAGAALSAGLLQQGFDARINMGGVGGSLALMVLLTTPVLWWPGLRTREGHANSSHEPFPHRRAVWRSPLLRRLGTVALCAAIAEGAMVDWTGVYLVSVLGSSLAFGAAGFAAFSVSMTIGRLTGDRIVARFGPSRVLAGSGLVAAAGTALALAAPAPAVAAGGFGVAGLGLANIVPLAFGAGAQALPAAPGIGVASVATLGYAGFLLGPPAIGFLAGVVGLRAALGVLIAAGVVVSILGVRVRPRPARAEG